MDPRAVLAGLDEAQHRAVTSPATPLAVMAPAGSGKTRVLTSRVAHRIAIGEIEPAHVLCVTFTRKAATELRRRLGKLGVRDRIEAGTFHAIAWRQLRDRWAAQGRAAPELLDRVRPFLRDQLEVTNQTHLTELANEITWARARLLRPDDYAEAATAQHRRTQVDHEQIAANFAAYEIAKTRRHVLDFDDLLAACTSAIGGDPAFAAAQRWRFRHLFVDEFQDVNPLQFALLEAWRGEHWDAFVVGDSHQSIYGWNGAEPEILDDLRARWPALEVIHLDRTHRSTPEITAAAAAVIRAAGLHERHPESQQPPGPPVRVVRHEDESREVSGIARALRRQHGAARSWSSMAVLARTHQQVVDLEKGLTLHGIPAAVRRQATLLDDPAVREILRRLQSDDRPVLTALADALGTAEHPTSVERMAEAAESQRILDDHLTGAGFASWARANLVTDEAPPDAVTVSTIHSAKGLEWQVVHIAGCEDGSIPLASARRRAARAEEARLLYVAITRAGNEATIHWAAVRTQRGRTRTRERSPFLEGFEDHVDALTASSPTGGAGVLEQLRSRLGDTHDIDPVRSALVAWRTGRARAARTSPDVVLPDEVIDVIARTRPATVAELDDVPGMGPARRHRYGDELLAVVARTAR